MDYEEAKQKLEGMVSDSDIPIFDLLSAQMQAIQIACEIFADRNPIDASTSLGLGLIQTLIALLFSKKVDCERLNNLIRDGENLKDD